MGNNFEKYNEEISKNISFLQNNKNLDCKSIVLLCVFYGQKLQELSDNFDKIFTNHCGKKKNYKTVNRVSIVNTKNIFLLSQIKYFKLNLYINLL